MKMIEPSSDASASYRSCSLYVAIRVVSACLLILKIAEFAVSASARSCNVEETVKADSLDECPREAEIVQIISITALILGVSTVWVDYCVKVWWVLRMKRGRLGEYNLSFVPGVTAALETDSWVPVATRSFFLETSAAVKSACAQAVLLQLPTLILTFVTNHTPGDIHCAGLGAQKRQSSTDLSI